MVLTTAALLQRYLHNPDRIWKRRRILSLSAHLYGRQRNCYKISVNRVYLYLKKETAQRKEKTANYVQLWETRLTGACGELGTTFDDMRRVLNESGIGLDRKILNELAIWEPRSFRAIASLTKAVVAEKEKEDPFGMITPPGVVTRGMVGECGK